MSATTAVRHSITVNAPQERAFTVFTRDFNQWWPRTHKIGHAELAEAVVEGREGGRWYERDVDGSECEWGTVLVWKPPSRLVLGWQISGEWAYDPDLLTEVEVSFVSEGPNQTRVELEHRGLEAYGEHMEEVRKSIDSPGGWPGILELFGKAAAAAA
ncbi:MAG: SRPBCC family protein [Solirubrobacterales bacterium]|nr:SRPBCC family protein [Solirubrobacterales bacterium]